MLVVYVMLSQVKPIVQAGEMCYNGESGRLILYVMLSQVKPIVQAGEMC